MMLLKINCVPGRGLDEGSYLMKLNICKLLQTRKANQQYCFELVGYHWLNYKYNMNKQQRVVKNKTNVLFVFPQTEV